MEFVDWLIFGLSLILAAIGAVLVAAWAIYRIANPEDDWR